MSQIVPYRPPAAPAAQPAALPATVPAVPQPAAQPATVPAVPLPATMPAVQPAMMSDDELKSLRERVTVIYVSIHPWMAMMGGGGLRYSA